MAERVMVHIPSDAGLKNHFTTHDQRVWTEIDCGNEEIFVTDYISCKMYQQRMELHDILCKAESKQ